MAFVTWHPPGPQGPGRIKSPTAEAAFLFKHSQNVAYYDIAKPVITPDGSIHLAKREYKIPLPIGPFIIYPNIGQKIDIIKGAFREKLRAERAAAHAARPDAPKHAARYFIDHIPRQQTDVIALYHPLKDELDTKPLAQFLLEAGTTIALPVVTGKNAPLVFRKFEDGDTIVLGSFGVMTPTEDAPVVIPKIVVTPLLGFAKNGARLGYGGGYYDRTLEQLRRQGDVLAIGFAFGAQELDKLPTAANDQTLDWVVTERGAFKTSRQQEKGTPLRMGIVQTIRSLFERK